MRAVPRMTATSMPQGTFSRSGTSVSQEESPGFSRGEGVNLVLIPTLYHRRSQQHGHEPVYRMPVDHA